MTQPSFSVSGDITRVRQRHLRTLAFGGLCSLLFGCSGTPPSTCNSNSVDGGPDSCATGGVTSTGGASTGGTISTGGTVTTGGSVSTGGTAATGGTIATGGTTTTGGAATGGSSATGGTRMIIRLPTGGATSSGGAATGGSMATGGTSSAPASCVINSVFYPSGTFDPDNVCLSCQPAVTTAAWVPVADGTGCASGKVCHTGSCQSLCWIGSTLYAPDAANPNNSCQSCQPVTSTTAWSSANEGAICAAGQVCHSGTCQAGCVMAGAYYASGIANPGNPCQSCQPSQLTTSWSNVPTAHCVQAIAAGNSKLRLGQRRGSMLGFQQLRPARQKLDDRQLRAGSGSRPHNRS